MTHLDPRDIRFAPISQAAAQFREYAQELSGPELYAYKQGVQDALEFAMQLVQQPSLSVADIRRAFNEYERVTGLDGGALSLPARPKMDGVE